MCIRRFRAYSAVRATFRRGPTSRYEAVSRRSRNKAVGTRERGRLGQDPSRPCNRQVHEKRGSKGDLRTIDSARVRLRLPERRYVARKLLPEGITPSPRPGCGRTRGSFRLGLRRGGRASFDARGTVRGIQTSRARSRLLERSYIARKLLPKGVTPALGPDATALYLSCCLRDGQVVNVSRKGAAGFAFLSWCRPRFK